MSFSILNNQNTSHNAVKNIQSIRQLSICSLISELNVPGLNSSLQIGQVSCFFSLMDVCLAKEFFKLDCFCFLAVLDGVSSDCRGLFCCLPKKENISVRFSLIFEVLFIPVTVSSFFTSFFINVFNSSLTQVTELPSLTTLVASVQVGSTLFTLSLPLHCLLLF